MARAILGVVGAVVCLGSVVQAETVRVVVTGEVESNGFTTGTYAGVPSGAPVTMTIDLDSTNFLDSAALPTRMRWIPGTVVAPNDPPPPPPPPPLAIPTIDTELVDTFDGPKVRETVTNTDSLGRTVWVIRRVTRATGEVPLEALMPTDPLIEGATQADAEAEEVMFGMPLVIEEDMPESNTVGSIVVSYDVYSAASATPQTRIANILTAQVMRTNMCSEAFMPQIEEEPADVIAHVDDAADFAIIASDPLDGDLTFQWRKDGVDIEGETGDSITVEPLTDESSGYYQCVVTSSCGMTLSRPAHLEVIPPCEIVVDAVDTSACAGRAAVFQIEAGGDGLTPNVYQWQIKGGTTSGSWRDIADGSDITRDGVSFTSQGANTNKLAVWVFGAASDEFRCNVTTGCGGFRSNEVNLVVSDTGDCAQCPACPADYDNNGGVDGGDLASFFTDFEQGIGCADVDGNGGIDGGDLASFFTAFEQGGC